MALRLIGVTGYARSGKNEFANGLVELGYEAVAFADGVRDAAYALNPYIGGLTRLKDIIDDVGWEGAKTTAFKDEVRNVLQRMGTEVGRDLFGENVWVEQAFKKVESTDRPVVITDVRFPNEARAVQEHGGVVVRVTRPGVDLSSGHTSETLVDEIHPEYVVRNAGSIADLHYKARLLVSTHI